ncbi:polycystin-1-like protein 1 [Discoglossus pictus]
MSQGDTWLDHSPFPIYITDKCSKLWCLPCGDGEGKLAVYRSDGPYIHNVSIRHVSAILQTGKPFLLEISGYLASFSKVTLGLQNLYIENISAIQITVNWSTNNISRYIVPVQVNGSFTTSMSWIYMDPGNHSIGACVENLISVEEHEIHVEVLLPEPRLLKIKIVQTEEEVPSCIPYEVHAIKPLVRVYIGINYQFHSFVSMGRDLNFKWYFTDNNHTQSTSGLGHDGLYSIMNHTFTNEGLYQVKVNVSNQYNWICETINVAVIKKAVLNMTLDIQNDYVVTLGNNLTLVIKLFTTVRRPLLLNVTFAQGVMHSYNPNEDFRDTHLQVSEIYGIHDCYFYCLVVYMYEKTGVHNISVSVTYGSRISKLYLPQLVRVYEPIDYVFQKPSWQIFIPRSQNVTFSVDSPSDKMDSKCQWSVAKAYGVKKWAVSDWHINITFNSTGYYTISVMCFNPVSRGTQRMAIEVQEAITNLTISSSYGRYIQSGAILVLNATIGNGSAVTYVWVFSDNNTSIVSEDTSATHVFTHPGIQHIRVMATNNVSSDTATLELVVQDSVGQITLNVPNYITVNHVSPIYITVTTGSNVSLVLFLNESITFQKINCTPNEPVTVLHNFTKVGLLEFTVIGLNQVSQKSASLNVSVVEELHTTAIEMFHRPMLGEDIILVAKVNGQLRWEKHYTYKWTFAKNTYESGSPVLTYRCTDVGPQIVTLTVTYFLFTVSCSVQFNITKYNIVPDISHLSNVILGKPVEFLLKNMKPEKEIIMIHFGDGTQQIYRGSDSTRNSLKVSHTYQNAGIYTVSLNINQKATEISSVLVIQEPLQGLTLHGPKTAILSLRQEIPAVVSYAAGINRGSNYIYRWFFSDGETNRSLIGSPQLHLQLMAACNLTVELQVENHFGSLWASIFTIVQYSIQNVSLTVYRTAVGHPTRLSVIVEPHQDYIVQLDFGDGDNISVHSQELHVKGCFYSPLFCSILTFEHIFTQAAQYNVSLVVLNSVSQVRQVVQAIVEEPMPEMHVILTTPDLIALGDLINATVSLQFGTEVLCTWLICAPFSCYNLYGSSISIVANASGIYNLTVFVSSSLYSQRFILSVAKPVTVQGPIDDLRVHFPFGTDHATLIKDGNRTYATETLEFQACCRAEASFLFDFGDGTPVVYISGKVQTCGFGASIYHRYQKAGVYFIRVIAFNKFFSATDGIGPYYVLVAPNGLSLVMNSSIVHKDDVILFNASLKMGTNVSYTWNMGDQTTYVNEGPVMTYKYSKVATYNITVTAWNKVGCQMTWKIVSVLYRMQPVSIFTNGTVYSTESEIKFFAVTAENDPIEFSWYFQDGPPERTSSRTISKRFSNPNRYNIVVNASNRISSFTSDIHTIIVQRKVIPNRLVARSSVLVNSSVTFECRINSGTNISYLWNFGDGTIRFGKNIDQYVYSREGEFTVHVSVFNNISFAFLTKQIFVVKEHCQPPPVKHMGPLKIQIRKYQNLHLGVTFEAAIMCDISQGLLYSWSFVKSDGAFLTLPAYIDNTRQTITLPRFFLDYGIYTAIARVQIIGTVVYSNYTVQFEVLRSDPVSVIAEGTHLFIDQTTVKYFTLDGAHSFDPDNPEAHLRFHWRCAPVSTHSHSCFHSTAPNPLQSSFTTITFPTDLLNSNFDQFQFTLSVSSGNRVSSDAQVFLSMKPKTKLRSIQLTCFECTGSTINWNDRFSVQAVCADCSQADDLSYLWNLYWVNATDTSNIEVPFCQSLEVLGSSSLFAPIFPSIKTSASASSIHVTSNVKPYTTPIPFQKPIETQFEPSQHPALELDDNIYEADIQEAKTPSISRTVAQDADHVNTDPTVSMFDLAMPELPYPLPGLLEESSSGGRQTRGRRSATDKLSSNESLDESGGHKPSNWTSNGFVTGNGEGGFDLLNYTGNDTYPDFKTNYFGIEEGRGGSRSRSEGEIGSISVEETVKEAKEGDDLVDSSSSDNAPPAVLMIDWSKLQMNNIIFNSYTESGLSSQTVTFKPFVLKSSKMYMLDFSLASRGNVVGKSQFYFTVNEMPQKMTCLVQPKEGWEMYTVFSIFCTSGKEDFHYDFSYKIGRSSRKTLYNGRDIQYYFSLPAGDPSDSYKVTIYTEITNHFGSKTQPCPVNVTVLPSFIRNTTGNNSPERVLYHDGLKNLSTLLLMGNHIEIRNYVMLVTEALNRLYTEESKTTFELQSKIRHTLISSVCSLSFQEQEEIHDIVYMLSDLLNITKQVTPDSVMLITNTIKSIVREYTESVETPKILLERKLVEDLISLISSAMEVSYNYSGRNNYVMQDGMKSISDLLLRFITLNNELQFNISTNLMDLQTNVHPIFENNIQTIGPTKFKLPQLIDRHGSKNAVLSNTCYISELVHFKKNPYVWATGSSQLHGDFAGCSLFSCSTRRKINAREAVIPVTMEFESKISNDGNTSENVFSLDWDKVNYHHFSSVSKNKEEAMQISVTFSQPGTRAFPVLLLLRYSEKPTTALFNIKQVHHWETNETQIFIPVESIRDRESGYLALMDADYNRIPKNKYLSKVINYTIDIQWVQCLYWDTYKQWKSDDCYPQKGTNKASVNCSCKHFSMFTISRRQVSTHMNIDAVAQFVSTTKNLVPCTVVLLSILLYIVLAIFCKLKDKHEDKKNGFVLLQDNSPTDQQQYAIIVDVGFRSRPKSTAKVHIVLHGEDGVSETRELYCPDKPLFGKNSRHTFIMSIPESLGPIWKIHIWHNNSGHSPSLYLSHVIVKDLKSGTNWYFLAECWLAVDEGDGKVEREFTSIGHGLGFRKLFYCKLTEYLEDFHLWASVLSRPSYSWFNHTQRVTVCLVLLLGYMAMNAVLIHLKEDQYTAEMGFINMSTVSMMSGLQATLAIYPIALLLSLLFRYSEKKMSKDSGEERFKATKESEIFSIEGHRNSLSAADTMYESNLTWQHFQYWAYDAWKKKYERDFFTPSIHSGNSSKRSEKGSLTPSNQSSSGFEDGSSNGHQPVLKDFKRSLNDISSEYSSNHSIIEHSTLHNHKVLPSWFVYLTWLLCVLFSMTCVAVTLLIGFRFGATKCIFWLHALFFSVIYCIFIIQPIMIFAIALIVAWWKKDISDFFAEELCDATKCFLCEPVLFSQNFAVYARQNSHETSTDFDKILAARKRARYLRLARPPTPAQLRIVKDKIRKKTLIQQTFRECLMYIVMTFMLIFIAYGKFSHDEYFLNQAVRNIFTRHNGHAFDEIKTEDGWWNWSFSALLDGLYLDKWYKKASERSEAGPIGGHFFLIGSPILRELRDTNDSACMVPSIFTSIIEKCGPSCSLSKQASDMLNMTRKKALAETQDETYNLCGKVQCYQGRSSVFRLGKSRTDAYSALLKIRNHRWMEKKTRALIVQFALYNPPTNLFTMVSLLTELPAAGGVITSSLIESVRIYHIISLVDYIIMTFELGFLGLNFVNLYFQLSRMIQKGIRNYLQDPWNWTEICIIGLGFCYYTNQVCHFILTTDVVDRLQKGFFEVFVDFSFIAEWEQWARCLHGIILYFMIIKCIKLLRIYKVMAPCMAMLRLSCSSTLFTMVIGVIITFAYSSSGHVLFLSSHYSFSSAITSFQTVLFLLLGAGGKKTVTSIYSQTKSNQVSTACFYGSFFIVMALLWSGLIRGVLISVAKDTKKAHRSKHLVTFKEIKSHASEKVLSIIGRQRLKSTESTAVTGNNFYLDEFEDLIDELLFCLNAISNSLHHSLPAKTSCFTEEEEEVNHLEISSDYYFNHTFESNIQTEENIQQEIMIENSKCVNPVIENDEKHRTSMKLDESHIPASCWERSFENCIHVENEFSSTQYKSTINFGLCEEEKCTINIEPELVRESETSLSNVPQQLCSETTSEMVQSYCITAVLCSDHCLQDEFDAVDYRMNNQTRCTSANILYKNRKPLKRSHTTVIELLDNSSTSVGDRVKDNVLPSSTHEEETEPQYQFPVAGSTITQFSLFQDIQCKDKNTIEKDKQKQLKKIMKQNKDLVLKMPDKIKKNQGNDDSGDLPCSIKHCWQ